MDLNEVFVMITSAASRPPKIHAPWHHSRLEMAASGGQCPCVYQNWVIMESNVNVSDHPLLWISLKGNIAVGWVSSLTQHVRKIPIHSLAEIAMNLKMLIQYFFFSADYLYRILVIIESFSCTLQTIQDGFHEQLHLIILYEFGPKPWNMSRRSWHHCKITFEV